MSPIESDFLHEETTKRVSSSNYDELKDSSLLVKEDHRDPLSNDEGKNFQWRRNEESGQVTAYKSKKKESHKTINNATRNNIHNPRQLNDNIKKYTITNCGFPSLSKEDDECDNEVASILENVRMRESPRSLLELERKYPVQSHEEYHDHDSYIADGEDNNQATRRHFKTKKNRRRLSFDAKTKKALPIMSPHPTHSEVLSPPPIVRKKRIDIFPTFVPNAENDEVNSATIHSNTEYLHNNSAGQKCPRGAMKDSELDNGSPNYTSLSYESKCNSSTPGLPGLCPSSYDTIGSGYGSLDYSSGTDQSHDTLPASNRSLVTEDRVRKSSFQKGRKSNRSKPCPKGGNMTEQLPLVPEDISMRNEENSFPSEDQSLVGNGQSKMQYNNELRSPKRKKQRQIVISHLLDEVRGCKQPASCHDKFFAILFYVQVMIIFILGMRYGPQAFGYNGIGTGVTIEYGVVAFTYKNVIILTLGSGIVAIMISTLLLFFMTTAAKSVIPLSLFIAMTLALIGSVLGIFFSPKTYVPIIGLVSFGVCVVFTFIVWDRIPFVTAQLNTALSALKEAYSIIFLACIMQMIALVGIVFYFFTCIGIYDYFQVDQTSWPREWKIACYIGLAISFNWTFKVLSVRF